MTGRNVSFQPKQGLQLWFGRFLQNTSHEFAQGVALDFTQNHLSSVVRCCFLSTSSCLRSFWVWIFDAQHSFYQIYDNYRLHAQLFNNIKCLSQLWFRFKSLSVRCRQSLSATSIENHATPARSKVK